MSLQGRLREGKKKEFVSSRNQSTPVPRTSSHLLHHRLHHPNNIVDFAVVVVVVQKKRKFFFFLSARKKACHVTLAQRG